MDRWSNAINETSYDTFPGNPAGRATYADAQTWANNLTFTLGGNTFAQWRLPSSSELVALGTTVTNTNGFSNIQWSYYWSDTTDPSNANIVLAYFAGDPGGYATWAGKTTAQAAVAVMNGDVLSSIPEPKPNALMLAGLALVGGLMRRRNATTNVTT